MSFDDSVLQFFIDSVLYAHRRSPLRESERKKAMERHLAMVIAEHHRPKKQDQAESQ